MPQKLAGPTPQDTPQRMKEALKKRFPQHYKVIADNNGIKEKNVWDLFGPPGMPHSAVGVTLLPSLDSLGALRGNHAHSSANTVASVLDPELQFKAVTNVVNDLLVVNGWLANYQKRIR